MHERRVAQLVRPDNRHRRNRPQRGQSTARSHPRQSQSHRYHPIMGVLAPWAEVLYGIDTEWWIVNRGVPEFKGMKVSPSPRACKVFRLRQVSIKPVAEILAKEMGVLGCGLRTGRGYWASRRSTWPTRWAPGASSSSASTCTRIPAPGFIRDARRGVAKPDAGRTREWRKALDGSPRTSKPWRRGAPTLPRAVLTAYPMVDLLEAVHGADGAGAGDRQGVDAPPF